MTSSTTPLMNQSEKHYLTHMAIIRCVELILSQQTFVDTARDIFNFCKNILDARAGYVALIDHTGKYFEVLHLDSRDKNNEKSFNDN